MTIKQRSLTSSGLSSSKTTDLSVGKPCPVQDLALVFFTEIEANGKLRDI